MKPSRRTLDVLMVASIPLSPGGMFHHLMDNQRALEKAGYRCELMLNSRWEDRIPSLIMKLFSPYIVFMKVLLKLLCGERVGIVQIHEPSAYVYASLSAIFSFLPPCYVRSHGVEARFDADFRKRRKFRLRHTLFRRCINFTNAIAFRNCHKILVNNTADLVFLTQRYGRDKVLISNFSVPQFLLNEAHDKRREDRIVVTSIGEWRYEKGRDVLEEVILRTIEKEPRVFFQLLGVQKDIYRESPALRPAAGRLCIVEKFDMPDDLVLYLNQSHIFLSTSYWESGPLTVLESMCFFNAVICSENCFLIRDIARSGEEAIIVKHDSVEDYVQWIVRLARDPVFRRELGQRGRRLVERHTPEKAIEAYRRDLESVWGT